MATSEVLYEISRFDPSGEREALVERFQLVNNAGALFVLTPDGSEVPCQSTDVESEISGHPELCDVNADEVTRITASDEALRYLPLLLRAPGAKSDFDSSLWSSAMSEEHISGSRGEERGAIRVLYVNGRRWGVFDTTDGLRLMPDDIENSAYGNGSMPSLDQWAEVTFGESASMTYGMDRATVGLATPGVVVSTWEPDVYEDEVRLGRCDDAVDSFLAWLLDGGVCEQYYGRSQLGQVLMVRLLAIAAEGETQGKLAGDYLMAGLDIGNHTMIGMYGSSEWTLDIGLDDVTVDAALERLLDRGDALSEAVLAVRDPQSLPGQRRRAALGGPEE